MKDDNAWRQWLQTADNGRPLQFMIDHLVQRDVEESKARDVISWAAADFYMHLHRLSDCAGASGVPAHTIHWFGRVEGHMFGAPEWWCPPTLNTRHVEVLVRPKADLRLRHELLVKIGHRRLAVRRQSGELFADGWGSWDGEANQMRNHCWKLGEDGEALDAFDMQAKLLESCNARDRQFPPLTAVAHVSDPEVRARLQELLGPTKTTPDVSDPASRAEACRRLGACAHAWMLADRHRFQAVIGRIVKVVCTDCSCYRICQKALMLHHGASMRFSLDDVAQTSDAGSGAIDAILMYLDGPEMFMATCSTFLAAGRQLGYRPPRLVLKTKVDVHPREVARAQSVQWEQRGASNDTTTRIRKNAWLYLCPEIVVTRWDLDRQCMTERKLLLSGSGVANATSGGIRVVGAADREQPRFDDTHPHVTYKLVRIMADGAPPVPISKDGAVAPCREELVHAHIATLTADEKTRFRGTTDSLALSVPGLPALTYENPLAHRLYRHVPYAFDNPRLMVHKLSSELPPLAGATNKLAIEATCTFQTAGWPRGVAAARRKRADLEFSGPYEMKALSDPFVCMSRKRARFE